LKLPSNGASMVGVCPVADEVLTGKPVVTTAGAAAVAWGRTADRRNAVRPWVSARSPPTRAAIVS
jgi:hypothetical protein